MLEQLKNQVWKANLGLLENGLVIIGEGNVSGISGDRKYVVIKPSGLDYRVMKQEDMVVVDMEGRKVEGALNASVDTAIHLEIYKAFPQIGSVIHTHSMYPTIFAQRAEPIPCLGTTHADAFCGDIPVTRELTDEEIRGEYEKNTGKVINEVLDVNIPAVLVPHHGPFVFGAAAEEALNNAIILEKVARMALLTDSKQSINPVLLDRHYQRKHGQNRYYGQC